MSRSIDEKVVEMRFDNQNFEKNVSTSMSTLEKLNKSLRLKGATKGFQDIDSASRKVNMSGLGSAVEAVQAKFSALSVVGVTALANITNSAVNAGKRIVSALTIDPIKTGFREYETQINSVQTILANTESKGSTINDVNKALDTLNLYADKTIYNFTEMTRNIGTFTAAGIDLETSATAIQGIANMAAVSGSTSQQASVAMYQLSQALASGTVKLMDWNSVVNAGMGGQVFQDALKETSRQMVKNAESLKKMSAEQKKAWQESHGYTDDQMKSMQEYGFNVDKIIEKNGSFRESLSEGWITADVLTMTLGKMTKSGVIEYVADMTGATKESVTELQNLGDELGYSNNKVKELALSIANGDEELSKTVISTVKMATTAEDAATKVKTLTQLWDTLKEAAQSGWTQTWETAVGDFEEAKELYTRISDAVGGIISASAESRNKVLGEGLSSGWKQFISSAEVDEQLLQDSITSVAKDLGVSLDELIEKNGSFEKSLKEGWMTSDILKKSITDLADKTKDLSDEELLNIGYTREQATAIQELYEKVQQGEIDLDKFAESMARVSGRENIIEGFANIFKNLSKVIKPIGEAFREIFPSITGDQVYSLTERFRKFTEQISISEDTIDKIKRTFKGFFSIFDMGKKVITAILKPIGQLIGSEGIGSLGSFLLDMSARIGDFFTSLNESFSTDGITGALSNIVNGISNVIKAAFDNIKGFGKAFSSVGESICNVVSKIWSTLSKTFVWIAHNVSFLDIFAGLTGGGIFVLATKLSSFVSSIKKSFDRIFNPKTIKNKQTGFSDILNSLHDSLMSFTTGIRVSSLVSIAASIGILSASLNTLAKLKMQDISKGLFAIGAMLTGLTIAFKVLTKGIGSFENTIVKSDGTMQSLTSKSGGYIKTGIALMLLAKSISIMSDSLVKLSDLSLAEIGKGLTALGGSIAELCIGAKILEDVNISIKTAVTILALAEACKILSGAFENFGSAQLDEIGRGLIGMGGALAELVGAIVILQNFGGFKSLFGSLGILILIQGLGDIANALQKLGSMPWSEIDRGVVAMFDALAEVTAATVFVGKLAGFSSIFGAAGILLAIKGLDDLANALAKFGSMQWDEIDRGLVAMGGALIEVGGMSAAVGALSGFAGIVGAGTILLTIQGLDDLANALAKFGSMQWDEIDRGLVAMFDAVAEVGGLSAAIGVLSGFAGIVGAGTILLTIQGLDDLANGLQKFGSMQWSEIDRGLVAMGTALMEVGGISAAIGVLSGFAGLVGAGTITLAVQGLDDLANGLQKFGEMSWDEIGRGLTAMGAALETVGLGALLSTFSGFGASALSTVAAPLGALADSMKKWAGVTVPEGLGTQLGILSSGIQGFTFGGAGASALSTAAPGVGIMAESVQKWSGVTVPDNLGSNLIALAAGVEAFTFGGLGAGTLSEAAPAIGSLADSVKKWSGISVPDNLGTTLTNLAYGVKSFSFAFLGGWSIDAVVEPLKSLATSVKAWNGISVPGTLGDDLDSLASGVKAFSFAFLGGWSIGAILEPLKSLASSVKAWNGVSVPSNLESDLSSLADGVKAFDGISHAPIGVTVLAQIHSAASKLGQINFSYINSGLKNLASALNGFGSVNSSLSGVGATVATNLVTPIRQTISVLMSVGGEITNAIASGINSTQGQIAASMNTMVGSAINAIRSQSSKFRVVGVLYGTSIGDGIKSKSSSVSSATSSAASSAAQRVRNAYRPMYNAGSYLMDGLKNGINDRKWVAINAAKEVAQRITNITMGVFGEKSPSRVFMQIGRYLDEGLAIGINDRSDVATNSASNMASSVIGNVQNAISKAGDMLSANVDAQPTIKPIVDLSEVRRGANTISGIFGSGPSVGVMANVNAISSSMNSRGQNGNNSEVVSAINKLRDKLDGVGNTYNTINGVTYDDGSNVTDAIETLVRYAKIGGRV